jgi:predicted  nucleic acid-binding Zn-ribbon protein
MADQVDELREERAKMEKQLESIKAAIENFRKSPEEFSYELAKAEKDKKFVEGRIKEIDEKLSTLSE